MLSEILLCGCWKSKHWVSVGPQLWGRELYLLKSLFCRPLYAWVLLWSCWCVKQHVNNFRGCVVPALFPLRGCVCGAVQGMKSSSQADPFPCVLPGAVHEMWGGVRFSGSYGSFLPFLRDRAAVPEAWVSFPEWWGQHGLLSLGGLQGCHSQVTEELILLLGGEQLQGEDEDGNSCTCCAVPL